jgi:ADP-heptose:LPS heptosyltransferase
MQSLLKSVKNGFYRLVELALATGPPRRSKKLAIFKADGIGDFVLSSEAIRQLIDEHGTDEVTLIISFELRDLAATMFPGVEIKAIAPGHASRKTKLFRGLALMSAIKSAAYDEVVCLRHYRTRYEQTILRALVTKKVLLLANQSAASDQGAGESHPGHFSLIEAKAYEGADDVPREWAYHAAVLSKSMGRHVAPSSMRPDWDMWRATTATTTPFLLIAPLAGRRIRDLPPDLVQAAASKAAHHGLHHLILSGSRKQAALLGRYAEMLKSSIPHCRVDLEFPRHLPELVRLVSRAALVMTAETSTAHIASALDKPSLILIGGGHYGWFAPWRRSDKQVWLTNKLPCFDCSWRCLYPEPICITDVTAAQVEAAMPAAE